MGGMLISNIGEIDKLKTWKMGFNLFKNIQGGAQVKKLAYNLH
jgi:hypothetical protein